MEPLDFSQRYPRAPLTIFDTLTNFTQILTKAGEIREYENTVTKNGDGNVEEILIRGYDYEGYLVFEADILYNCWQEQFEWRVYQDKFSLVERNFKNEL